MKNNKERIYSKYYLDYIPPHLEDVKYVRELGASRILVLADMICWIRMGNTTAGTNVRKMN